MTSRVVKGYEEVGQLMRYVMGWGRDKTYPASPSSCTLSHKFKMSSQFSLVRFSSVVFAVGNHDKTGQHTTISQVEA